jgi:dTDP-4-dehydrorhamnose reductase
MILVFGKTGQVATELNLQGAGLCLSRAQANFETPGTLAKAITAHHPCAVVNAVAYTAVDRAEEDRARAFRINAGAVSELAQTCAAAGIPLVHLSTDYVFDGSGTAPWQVTDAPIPLSVYGQSKLAGEDAVRAAGGPHAILRTSWVVSAHGNNFVKTMLRLGREKEALSIVADQRGAPTSARDIATACLEIASQLLSDPCKSGSYHYQSRPFASWADVARVVFAHAGLSCTVTDIPSSAYPTPAARPLNSQLDCTTTQKVFGLEMPDWHISLHTVLEQLA